MLSDPLPLLKVNIRQTLSKQKKEVEIIIHYETVKKNTKLKSFFDEDEEEDKKEEEEEE